MAQDYDDEVSTFMEQPQMHETFDVWTKRHKWTNIGESLKFPKQSQLYSLFHKMWQINHTTKKFPDASTSLA